MNTSPLARFRKNSAGLVTLRVDQTKCVMKPLMTVKRSRGRPDLSRTCQESPGARWSFLNLERELGTKFRGLCLFVWYRTSRGFLLCPLTTLSLPSLSVWYPAPAPPRRRRGRRLVPVHGCSLALMQNVRRIDQYNFCIPAVTVLTPRFSRSLPPGQALTTPPSYVKPTTPILYHPLFFFLVSSCVVRFGTMTPPPI
eukprot:768575-Hanusia_phi.AAC.5